MGLIIPAGLNPPREIVALGEVIVACGGVEKVQLRWPRGVQTVRPPMVIFRGREEEFLAEYYFGGKKYMMHVSATTGMSVGSDVVSRVKKICPHIVIETKIQKVREVTNVASEKGNTEREKSPLFHEPFVVPREVWGRPRVLAMYLYIHNTIRQGDDPDFVLVDKTHGKARKLVSHLERAFSASGGTIDDPLRILRQNYVITRGMNDGRGGVWWIFRFVQHVPQMEEDPIALWALSSRQSGVAAVETSPKDTPITQQTASTPTDVSDNTRWVAAYHYIVGCFKNGVDGFRLTVEQQEGTIAGLYTKLEKGFVANAASVSRAITALEAQGILAQQKKADGTTPRRSAYAFRFSENVPLLPEGLTAEEFWHTRDQRKRDKVSKPLPIPAEVSSQVVVGPTEVVSMLPSSLPPDLATLAAGVVEGLRIAEEARKKSEDDVHELAMRIREDVVAECRTVHTLISDTIPN